MANGKMHLVSYYASVTNLMVNVNEFVDVQNLSYFSGGITIEIRGGQVFSLKINFFKQQFRSFLKIN